MDIKLKILATLPVPTKYQMDIYDVPITEVIEQYLAYISTLQAMRLEVAGEYMVMAVANWCWLMQALAKGWWKDDLEDDLEWSFLRLRNIVSLNFGGAVGSEAPERA